MMGEEGKADTMKPKAQSQTIERASSPDIAYFGGYLPIGITEAEFCAVILPELIDTLKKQGILTT